MSQKKIISILQTLNIEEAKALKTFVSSPFYNKNKDVSITLTFVLKYLDNSKSTEKDLEQFIIKSYKRLNKKIGLPGVKKHFTIIVKLTNKFIAINSFEQNELEQQIHLLNFYLDNGKKQQFLKLYEQLKNRISKQKEDVKKFKLLHDLEELRWFLDSTLAENRIGDANLNNKSEVFNKYYISEKLWTAIAIISRKKHTSSNFNDGNVNQLLINIEKNILLEDVFIKALFLAYKMLTASNQEQKKYFNLFIKHLTINADKFNNEKVYNFYNLIRSTAKDIYSNSNELYHFLYDLFKNLIQQKRIYINGKIHFPIFKNIVTIGIKLKKFDWVEQFVESHKALIIPAKLSADIYAYNLARIHFFKGELQQANQFILVDKIKDPYYKISMRRLELMLLFEHKEWLTLDAKINAFKTALLKNRSSFLSEIKRTYEVNFSNFFYRLFKIETDINERKNKTLILEKNIKAEQAVAEKEWLLVKVSL